MKTEYLPSFTKDLKKLKKTSTYSEIKNLVFNTIPDCQNITEIKSLKKIKGHKNAYRIRVGNYRIGVFIQKETVTVLRDSISCLRSSMAHALFTGASSARCLSLFSLSMSDRCAAGEIVHQLLSSQLKRMQVEVDIFRGSMKSTLIA